MAVGDETNIQQCTCHQTCKLCRPSRPDFQPLETDCLKCDETKYLFEAILPGSMNGRCNAISGVDPEKEPIGDNDQAKEGDEAKEIDEKMAENGSSD